MNASDFVLDKSIKKSLKETSTQIIVKKELYVYFPKRFIDVGLATLSETVKVVSILLIADKNQKAMISSLPLYVEVEPSVIDEVTIDDVEYVKLTLHENDLLVKSKKVIKDSSFIFSIVDEFLVKGKVPFYLNPTDLFKFFIESHKFSGANIGDNPAGIEATLSIIVRDKKDITKNLRFSKVKPNDIKMGDYQYVGLGNVAYGVESNIAKLTGRYFTQGVTSVLNKEQEDETDIEKYYKL